MATDIGIKHKLRIHACSSTTIAISRSRGLGEIKQLAPGDLRIQERVRNGDVKINKVAGKEHPAHAMAKYLDRKTLADHMIRLNLHLEKGRASSAPQLAGKEEKKGDTEPRDKEETNESKQGRDGDMNNDNTSGDCTARAGHKAKEKQKKKIDFRNE